MKMEKAKFIEFQELAFELMELNNKRDEATEKFVQFFLKYNFKELYEFLYGSHKPLFFNELWFEGEGAFFNEVLCLLYNRKTGKFGVRPFGNRDAQLLKEHGPEAVINTSNQTFWKNWYDLDLNELLEFVIDWCDALVDGRFLGVYNNQEISEDLRRELQRLERVL